MGEAETVELISLYYGKVSRATFLSGRENSSILFTEALPQSVATSRFGVVQWEPSKLL